MLYLNPKLKMNYNPVEIKAGGEGRILIIYTGGTLGMIFDEERRTLVPFPFRETLVKLPELKLMEPALHLVSLEKPIDSSDVNAEIFLTLAGIIQQHYDSYDGFVLIHGTDTMAFTASALSFLIHNTRKPIILTGAQLPIGIPRTDARENLITSIEIAGAKINGKAVVPEVCIYFNGRLLRGNRARKRESSQFDAFDSENYPYLAEIGVSIDYNFRHIRYAEGETRFYTEMSDKVSVLTLFPGISPQILRKHLLNEFTQGVIMMTYGSGNAPSADWFIDILRQGIDSGKTVINITQCTGGKVTMGKYASSKRLKDIGVISGSDMTLEASVGKMMWGLAHTEQNLQEIFAQNLAGEISLP
jgi:L-asparaginase